MKKTWKMLSALLITTAMVATTAIAGFAAEKQYDGLISQVTAPTVSFDKYLILDTTTNVPNVDFVFELSSVAADDTLGTVAGITEGVTFTNGASSSTTAITASFDPQSTTYTTVQGSDDLTLDAGKQYAKDTMTLDFSGVAFTEPGIYAYKLTEDLTGTGSAAVNGTERYLYVFVEDATDTTGNHLDITGYLLTTEDDAIDGTGKTTGIANTYPACSLTFGKEVTGNQGSRDKYFKFTVTLSGASIRDDDVYTVDMTNAIKEPTANAATIYSASDMKAANDITELTGAQLKAGYDFYLQDGNYITILGIPENYGYEITEEAEEYTSSDRIAVGDSSLDWDDTAAGNDALNDATSGDSITTDIHTGFTNDKEGTVPTGVLMKVGPIVIVGLAVVGGIVFLAVRNTKRKAAEENEEEA